jgi:hypothetical protein
MKILSKIYPALCALILLQPVPGVHADAPVFSVDKGAGVILAAPYGMAHEDWLATLKNWRDAQKSAMKFDGSIYSRPELLWAQRDYVQPQMMVEERYFYDPVNRKCTVDRYLDDLVARYGGIDSVLIWPVYPNVGIDNRSQHDLLRDLPGGLDGVKQMVADFHRRGVHVLFPMMPWEAGTRQEGLSLADATAKNFAYADIDGANGDTMQGIPQEFFDAALKANHPLAFEPENFLSNLNMLQWDVLSWGYWPGWGLPPVDRYKWIETRHLTHRCNRWSQNRIGDIQAAFFNGDGYESWENIWGIWNQLTDRDAEAVRRTATIERGLSDLLVSPDWEPYTPTLQRNIYASKFPVGNRTAWLLVNAAKTDVNGDQLTIPFTAGTRFFDLWHGSELSPKITGDTATLSFTIEASAFGAVLALNGEPTPDLAKLLATMAELNKKRLADFSTTWKALPQTMVDIAPTASPTNPPEGMILIPEAPQYDFKIHGVEIEGWKYDNSGVDVQYPWETLPQINHEHQVDIKAFYLDKFPVTNEAFKKFIDATNYHPADDHNFLKDWSNGTYPQGWDKKPVTWVSLEDARAYAAWAGKRLPHEWEWQYAAQGTDGRPYPWGMKPDPMAVPPKDFGHDLRGPTDVDAFPKGASPFGVMDLVGNVWQWTDEFQDEHTRAAIVRGGSYYWPSGSKWYFPQNTTLDQHGKYLLMSPGKDRAGTLGFRCAMDK